METQTRLLNVAADCCGPELNGLAPEKQAGGDVLGLQEEGGAHQVEGVTDPLQGVIMHIKQEVEDGQRALDARCLQRVIPVLAALVQVCPGLGWSLCEKYI